MMVKIKDLMTLERLLLEIDIRFKFDIDFSDAYKLYKYLKDIGKITSYAFLLQDQFHKKFNDETKLKEYHNKIMSSSAEYDSNEVIKFIEDISLKFNDESFENIMNEIKFWS